METELLDILENIPFAVIFAAYLLFDFKHRVTQMETIKEIVKMFTDVLIEVGKEAGQE